MAQHSRPRQDAGPEPVFAHPLTTAAGTIVAPDAGRWSGSPRHAYA